MKNTTVPVRTADMHKTIKNAFLLFIKTLYLYRTKKSSAKSTLNKNAAASENGCEEPHQSSSRYALCLTDEVAHHPRRRRVAEYSLIVISSAVPQARSREIFTLSFRAQSRNLLERFLRSLRSVEMTINSASTRPKAAENGATIPPPKAGRARVLP